MQGILLNQVLPEPIQIIIERGMLLGIKQRVGQASKQKIVEETDNIPLDIVSMHSYEEE